MGAVAVLAPKANIDAVGFAGMSFLRMALAGDQVNPAIVSPLLRARAGIFFAEHAEPLSTQRVCAFGAWVDLNVTPPLTLPLGYPPLRALRHEMVCLGDGMAPTAWNPAIFLKDS